MPVHVSFMKPDGVGGGIAMNVGICRAYEVLTVPATTTAAAQDGEQAIVVNTEDTAVTVARGYTPDAEAAASTTETDAAVCVASGMTMVFQMRAGHKIDVAAE